MCGDRLRFVVKGYPSPQAGVRPVPTARGVRMISTGGQKLEGWRNQVTAAALKAATEARVRFQGPVKVTTAFFYRTPKVRAGERKIAPYGWKQTRPDGDKLTRAVWDALTVSGIIEDDARIVAWEGWKIEGWWEGLVCDIEQAPEYPHPYALDDWLAGVDLR